MPTGSIQGVPKKALDGTFGGLATLGTFWPFWAFLDALDTFGHFWALWALLGTLGHPGHFWAQELPNLKIFYLELFFWDTLHIMWKTHGPMSVIDRS